MYNYKIEKIFFNKGLVNVPVTTVVSNGVEKLFAIEGIDLVNDKKFQIPMSISIELMRFGKILSPNAFIGISQMIPEEQKALADSLKTWLSETYCDGTYSTLFGDFPNTVLSMSEGEMLFHQICHYWGAFLGYDYWPNHTEGHDAESQKQNVSSIIACCCKDKYDVIEAGSPDVLADSLKPSLTAQQSLTDRDKEDIATFYKNIDQIALSPSKKLEMKNLEIPFKETLCIVASACLDSQVIKDINDVLRVALFMSDGDIALTPVPKIVDKGWRKVPATKEDKKAWQFKNFSNPEARQLLSSVNDIVAHKGIDVVADMKKYALRWIRLGEKLHPMSEKNKKKYPNAYKVFDQLRNNAKNIKTFGTYIEAAKSDKNLEQILNLYKMRPGEFARQIDWVLRTFVEGAKSPKLNSNAKIKIGVIGEALKNIGLTSSTEDQKVFGENLSLVISAFKDVLPKVSTKVLYELLEHFNARKEEQTSRQIFIKGARKPVDLPSLKPLKEHTVSVIQSALLKEVIARMASKEDLTGVEVYLDKTLENIVLPKNMRSTGEAVKQVSRGTRTPLPEISKLLRFFLFWKDDTGHEDLDLAVKFFDSNLDFVGHISWDSNYKLYGKNNVQYAQFSGDVRHRRGNCAEYVDVDIDKALENNARFLVAVARDFNAHSFSSAFGGVMARTTWGTPGEVTWAPSTVENGFKIHSNTQNVLLCIIDLKERQMIYVDEDMTGAPLNFGYNHHAKDVKPILERYINPNAFFNGLTLLETYFGACGAKVEVCDAEKIKKCQEVYNAAVDQQNKKIEACEDQDEKKSLAAELADFKKNNKIIVFDDIVSDYTKLFSYMF